LNISEYGWTALPARSVSEGLTARRQGPLGGVHVVEQLLGRDKLTAEAVLERLQEQARSQTGLADAGGADEDDVLGLGDEIELGERPDLAAV